MSSNIQIKFLTLEEMANAADIDYRYEHVGVDNLGFADKAKNRVYVRAGLEPQLQTLLIDHELEHLFELEGTDEDEFGIRHKKKGGFMKIFAPIAMAILGSIIMPGIGGLLPGLLGTLMGGAVGTGVGAGLGTAAGNSMVGKPNWIGATISGAGAGLGAAAGNALSGLGGTAGGTAGGMGGEAVPAGAGITFGSGAGSGAGAIGTGSGAFADVVGQGAGQAFGQGSNIGMNIAGQTAGQGAGSGIGQSIGQLTGSGLASLFQGAAGQGQAAQGGYGPASASQSFKMPDFSQQANNNPSYSGWGDSVAMPDMGSNYGMGGGQTSTGVADVGGLSKMPINPGLMQGGIGLAGRTGFNDMFGSGGQEMGMEQPQGFGGAMSF